MKTALTFGPGSFSTPAPGKELVLDSSLESEVSKQSLENKECGEWRKSSISEILRECVLLTWAWTPQGLQNLRLRNDKAFFGGLSESVVGSVCRKCRPELSPPKVFQHEDSRDCSYLD